MYHNGKRGKYTLKELLARAEGLGALVSWGKPEGTEIWQAMSDIAQVFKTDDTCTFWMDISEIIRVKTLFASP